MPEKVITLASTTSSQAELDHAAGDDWRTPPVPQTEVSTEASEPSPAESTSAADSEAAPKEQVQRQKGESHSGWQKRVDRLTARNKQIEARAAELEARLAEYERGRAEKEPTPAPAHKPAQDDGPKLEDYATPNEWHDARSEWARDKQRQQEESAARDQQTREVWDAHNARISEARAKYDDFDDVAKSSDLQIPNNAAMAIIEQPNSAEVAYYLATHADEAKKLIEMRPMQQIAAIARISDKLSSPPAPKPKPASQAPAPIKPVGGHATGSTVDLGSMSYQDYKRARAAQR